jgi:hypothetical protein
VHDNAPETIAHSHFSNNPEIVSEEDRSHRGEHAHEELVELWSENLDAGVSSQQYREESCQRQEWRKTFTWSEGLARHTYTL